VVPRFDLAIVSSMEEADRVIRPLETNPVSLIRPKGAILLSSCVIGELEPEKIRSEILSRGISIQTSRCGDLRKAIEFFQDKPEIGAVLEKQLITHIFPLDSINEAFVQAKKSDQCIKVLIETQ
jgi:threonine dehydrogenase-like Zn-dependent dehydrogenase